LKNELARAVFGKSEGLRSFPHSGYGVVDGLGECDSAPVAAFRNTSYARREVRRERQGEA